MKRLLSRLWVVLLLLSLTLSGQQPQTQSGPVPSPVVRNADGKLPQDSGRLGLENMLRKLHTTARLLQTTAHPDDEDGGMLVYESRGKGADVMLMTLTRGDGGQNKTGSNFFDELGVLRTLELLESDKYYGVKQRFSHVADFGFSKSPEETFQKWGGKEVPLADMVRVIRTFRPDVVASRFSGTPRDGHAHHQAVGMLTPEAVKAAADPNRFPEQIKEGLPAWQVKKLYMGLRGADDYTVRIAAGEKFEPLGMSYAEFGIQGYSHQKSQNAQVFPVQPGPSYRSYGLINSTVESHEAHEQDFFDGIDTTVRGLAQPLGELKSKAADLASKLAEISKKLDEATEAEKTDPVKAAAPLLAGRRLTNRLIAEIGESGANSPEVISALDRLHEKEQQFQEAANLALGISLVAEMKTEDDSNLVNPGQKFAIEPVLKNSSGAVITRAGAGPRVIGMPATVDVHLTASRGMRFNVSVPRDAEYTRPYWHRIDPDKDSVFIVDDPALITLPLPPPPVTVQQSYEFAGEEGVVTAIPSTFVNGQRRDLAVVPQFSIKLQHAALVMPTLTDGRVIVRAEVEKNFVGPALPTVKLAVPAGWQVSPPQQSVGFERSRGTREVSFSLSPGALKEGNYQITAQVEYNGKGFHEGFDIVSREDIDTFYYYQPAVQRVSVVDTKIPSALKVGYIMGAGDDIHSVLEHLGIPTKLISPDELSTFDLNQFGTIILGIRAYDTQDAVKKNNQRLLDFVSNGGTLIVQNNFSVTDFNNGKYTPYPAQLSNQRVSVEEAPITVLAPDDSVFHYPNTITQKDFDGWVQERGVNFMTSWDDHYQPLLSCNDPGEQPLKGGLLRAKYGKGTYIYTGYAFFRQLPYGVPGAVRLYVNLLSAGHEPAAR